jgi:CBS domain-containing protein
MNSLPEVVTDPEARKSAPLFDESVLELGVCDVMTHGVVTISDDATLDDAVDAMAAHRIHAVLFLGSRAGTALGWITTRGLLGLVGWDAHTPATEAITERATAIEPNASVRSAIYALALPGVTRLLVRHLPLGTVEGVITDFDLTVRATRLSRRPA